MTRRSWVVVAVVVAAVAATGPAAVAKGGPVVLTDRQEVAFRTNDEGVTLRVVVGKGESFTVGVCDEPGCLPKECQPIRAGYVAASTRRAVGEGYFDLYRRGDDTIRFVGGGSFGGIIEDPVSWVVAQVGPSVARVDATFMNGSRDSVEPRDGIVALASPVDDPAAIEGSIGQARLIARDADGKRIGRLLVRRDMEWPSPALECGFAGLPQEFPAPTGRVPEDSAAAQAAVIEAFAQAYGGAPSTSGDALAWIEDGPSLREVVAVATERYADYAGKISANVAEVRFVDADVAAVRFTVEGLGGLGEGIGTAVLRDGKWLVARDTFCSLLALGSVYCPITPDDS